MAFEIEDRDVMIFGGDHDECMEIANEFFLERYLWSFDLTKPERFGALDGYNRLDTVVWLIGDYEEEPGFSFLIEACTKYQIEIIDMNERYFDPSIIYDSSVLLH